MKPFHRITVICDGGVVQDVMDVPAGVEVVVADYDCEGCEDCERDADGERCHVNTFQGPPRQRRARASRSALRQEPEDAAAAVAGTTAAN